MRHILVASLVATSALAHAASVTFDNDTVNYTSNPAWSSVATGQVVGANQQVHTGMSAAGIVDNSSTGFSTTGTGWMLATLPGTVGTNYSVAHSSGATTYRIPTIVIDNATYGNNDSYGCIVGGTSTAGGGFYGRDYVTIARTAGAGPTSCTYRTNLSFAGNAGGTAHVTLSAHWPALSTNASNARFTAKNASGTVLGTWLVNQTSSSGEWAPIGSFDASLGTIYVTIDAQGANGNAIADAIRLEATDVASMKSAKWKLPNLAGKYDIYIRVPYSTTAEALPAVILVGGNGSTRSINASERSQPQQWVFIGTADLSGTQSNYVLLQQWAITGDLIADAIAYAPTGTFPIATWQSTVSTPVPAGNVTVSATWGANAARTHRAIYSLQPYVYTANGCFRGAAITTVVDQTLSGAGTVLGTVYVDPACPNVTVTLTPDADNGSISADAITFSN